jgi:hypothetical protein
MKRRTVLTGLSGLIAAATATIGSGAFANVSVERKATIRVADDNDAFLALSQLGGGRYSVGGRSIENGSPEVVQLSFPGVGERLNDPELGLGVDSVYVFERDSGESGSGATEGLLRIGNQGTQTVEVTAEHTMGSELEIELYDVTDSDRTALEDEPVELAVGDAVNVGVRIRTFEADLGTFNETITIAAEVPGND